MFDISTFLFLWALSLFTLTNHVLEYGLPWRPRRLGIEPETVRDRLERWMALTIAILPIVIVYLVLSRPPLGR